MRVQCLCTQQASPLCASNDALKDVNSQRILRSPLNLLGYRLRSVLSQAVAKCRDLSTVLAFMSIVHINNDIIQRIIHSIPGKCSVLTKHFSWYVGYERRHLGMCVIKLCQNFLHSLCLTFVHLAIIELTTQFNISVKNRGRIFAHNSGQYVYQHLLVGSEMGNDIFDRPYPTCARCFPSSFREAIDSLEYRLLPIFQNVCCVHEMVLSCSLTCSRAG